MKNPQQVKVKICGVQSLEMIQVMQGMPIEYIGFVFARSKRQVTAEQVEPWVKYLKMEREKGVHVPQTVGVFVNPAKEELAHIVKVSGIEVVQLHEQETPEFCQYVKQELGRKVIKSISVKPLVDHTLTRQTVFSQCEPYRNAVDVLLLDTYDLEYGGGTGKTFSWHHIPFYKEWTQQHTIDLFVAGGLHAENVTQLLDDYRVDGVDVSSGVETEGKKDRLKIQKFVERVAQYGSGS